MKYQVVQGLDALFYGRIVYDSGNKFVYPEGFETIEEAKEHIDQKKKAKMSLWTDAVDVVYSDDDLENVFGSSKCNNKQKERKIK